MLVLFDEDGREYLRVFAQATEDQKAKGTEINEGDIPKEEGYNTIIYKEDGEIVYKYEEIPKNSEEILMERISNLEETVLELLGGELNV